MALWLASLLLFTGQTSTQTRAAGAIFRSNLQRVAILFHALPLGLGPLEGCGRLVAEFGAVDLGANDGVRANHDALAALDAEVLVPHRDELRDVALLPLRGAGGECAAGGNGADWKQVAVARGDLAEHVADELRRLAGDGRDEIEVRGGGCGQLDLFKMREAASTAAKFFCTTASPRLP